MNIVHFSDTYYPVVNGVSFAIEQYAAEMGKDHKVLVICPSCSLRSVTEQKGNVTFRKLRSLSFPIYPGVQAVVPNVISLYKLLKEFKPDIIHTHTPFTLGILGTLFSQIMGVKLVSTYHTLFSSTVMYLSPRRFINGHNLTMKPKNEEQGIVELITWRLQMIFFNLADAVIAPTKIVETTLKAQGIKTKTKVIPSGINTEQFACKTNFTKTKHILHLGRLGLEKSTDIVIKAFAEVLKKTPDAKLIIAGDGPAKASLVSLTKSLKISPSVEFLGMVDHSKVPEVFRSCDFFVTASTMETQGLVILEAMLSGLPVIAAAVYAPIDLIKDDYNGYLFKENDIDECAKHMSSLIEGEKLEEIGRNAREFAEAFDSARLAQELITYYKEILSPQL